MSKDFLSEIHWIKRNCFEKKNGHDNKILWLKMKNKILIQNNGCSMSQSQYRTFMWKMFVVTFWIYGLIFQAYPINRFNSATLLCLSQDRTWIVNIIIMLWSFLCPIIDARGECLLCWYWQNCWNFFHKITTF
jgi:hypothetical protein